MDSGRGPTPLHHGAPGKQTAPQEAAPEQLLDVFKAAALSVTKLYKTSAMAESRARSEGYQECLDDLLMFLDRANLGLRDGEGWRIRAWATERLDGRDAPSNSITNNESEDENERSDRTNSPELTRTSTEPPAATQRASEPLAPTVAPTVATISEEHPIVVPTQDSFTFQSAHPYPNIATLDLSDGRPLDHAPKNSKGRHGGPRGDKRSGTPLGRGAGAKRRWDFEDFFGGCLGGKDPTGGSGGNKRGRHA